MILVDSLQILENEAVRSAIINARGYGMLIGICIMALLMSATIIRLNEVSKNELKKVEMSKYVQLKSQKNLIELIDICNKCIKGDIRIAKPTAELFGEFPGYDEERKAGELKHFPEISKQYEEIIQDRIAVTKTLDGIIEDDMKDILSNLAALEEKYPEETTKYNKEYKNYMANRQNQNNG